MALSLGLAGVLNNVTAPRTGNASLTKIERVELIPLKSLKSHPDNFYKLSDIEALAKLILLNKEIDTLTVKHNQETNDYTVISGHRRMAAVAWLVEHGKITEEEAKLPCKIVSKPSIDFFTEEEAEQFKIIAGNIGQRKYTTVDTIQEIVKTEPLARKIFDNLPEEERKSFLDFRDYFARTFFGKSSAWLQRLKSLSHLTDQAMKMVDNGEINVTAAAVLATMDPEQQAEFIEKFQAGEVNNTVAAIQNFKKFGTATEDEEESSNEEVFSVTTNDLDNMDSVEPINEPADTSYENEDESSLESEEDNDSDDSDINYSEVDESDSDDEPEVHYEYEDSQDQPESDNEEPVVHQAKKPMNINSYTQKRLMNRLGEIYTRILEMKISPNSNHDYESLLSDVKAIIDLLKDD